MCLQRFGLWGDHYSAVGIWAAGFGSVLCYENRWIGSIRGSVLS